jgi:hypothetical protein
LQKTFDSYGSLWKLLTYFGDLDYSYDIIDPIEALHPVLDGGCDKAPVVEMSYIVRKVVELSLLSLSTKAETIVEKFYETDSTVDTLYRKYLRDTINTDNRDN